MREGGEAKENGATTYERNAVGAAAPGFIISSLTYHFFCFAANGTEPPNVLCPGLLEPGNTRKEKHSLTTHLWICSVKAEAVMRLALLRRGMTQLTNHSGGLMDLLNRNRQYQGGVFMAKKRSGLGNSLEDMKSPRGFPLSSTTLPLLTLLVLGRKFMLPHDPAHTRRIRSTIRPQVMADPSSCQPLQGGERKDDRRSSNS